MWTPRIAADVDAVGDQAAGEVVACVVAAGQAAGEQPAVPSSAGLALLEALDGFGLLLDQAVHRWG
jgi:pyruvoyl-dependent arginine decarboxylase (PvlArgDC)